MTAVRHVEFGEFTEEQIRVQRAGEALHRDGASPAGALELLAAIIEDRTWERLADIKGRSFKGRFREFVGDRISGLGFDPDQLPQVISLHHPHENKKPEMAARMERMRSAVTKELKAEIPRAPEPAHAGPGRGNKTNSATIGFRQDRGSSYVIARLKRDDPPLAERVVRGEVTANAAAREKGWRKPRMVISTPEAVARALQKHMSAEDIARLIAVLLGREPEGRS